MKTITLILFIISSVANSQNDSQSESAKESCSRIEQLEHKVCLLEAKVYLPPVTNGASVPAKLKQESDYMERVTACLSALTEACKSSIRMTELGERLKQIIDERYKIRARRK